MRLIDADALKAHYAWWGDTESGKERKELFDEIVDSQPTVEVENVPSLLQKRGIRLSSSL